MSKRQTIYDTAKGVLEASTGINYVSVEIAEDPFAWKEDKFPAVRLIDGQEIKSRFCYMGSTDQLDMRSEFTLDFVGYVRELNKSTTGLVDSRNDLLAEIEKKLVADSTLLGLVADITPNDQVTDKGYLRGLGWVSGSFNIIYYYNHTAP